MIQAAGQVALLVFPLLMIAAGAGDVLSLRIPNRLCIALLVLFFPLAWAIGMPAWLLGVHVATSVVVLLIGYGLFSAGIFGAGDAKLMAAAALWLGLPCTLLLILYTALAGGMLAAVSGLLYVLSFEVGQRSASIDGMLTRLKPDVPYGFAIAAGSLVAASYSLWMQVASA